MGVGWEGGAEVDVALGVDVGPRETGVRVGLGIGEDSVCCAGLQPERRMPRSPKQRMGNLHKRAETG